MEKKIVDVPKPQYPVTEEFVHQLNVARKEINDFVLLAYALDNRMFDDLFLLERANRDTLKKMFNGEVELVIVGQKTDSELEE
ncbi:hypothetical protein [Weissella sp. MSCH1]|uniref:hypothetical protein n=1 Tax=Weissella sp. MSCH1 TaxID=3383343 RepID=UPI0038968DD9